MNTKVHEVLAAIDREAPGPRPELPSELATELGLVWEGRGETRTVYSYGTHFVVKVPRNHKGIFHNLREWAIWEHYDGMCLRWCKEAGKAIRKRRSPKVAALLAPVLGISPNGTTIAMEFFGGVSDYATRDKIKAAAANLGLPNCVGSDGHSQNIRFDGKRYRITDYAGYAPLHGALDH